MMIDLVIVGGGPSGLAAAHEAVGRGAKAVVVERLDKVGGLSRTTIFDGCRFDVGPHRFFTKNREVLDLFVNIAAEDLVNVKRLTRIFYKSIFFNYPLSPLNALFGLGPLSSVFILTSYLRARIQAVRGNEPITNFEEWVVSRFGRRLFETFFKGYTEKVWGIPCTQIGAEWANQRIKGLSLTTAFLNSLFKSKENTVKTLVDQFIYPRLGAGQLYEKMAGVVEETGSSVMTGARVCRVRRNGMRVVAVEVEDRTGFYEVEGRYFLMSAPLTDIVEMMHPSAPAEVISACHALRYRNHLGVNLVVEGCPFPDNWIYVHSKEVGMARIANYANFSPAMASRAGISPLTVEYFCFPGDQVWNAPDATLIRRASRELMEMKILCPDQVLDGFVVRSDKAYPVIEIGYQRHIEKIKSWLDQFENLLPIGRSGMFKYNNQDHAMATGLLAARTALGIHRYDPWLVNIDAEYHEAAPAPTIIR